MRDRYGLQRHRPEDADEARDLTTIRDFVARYPQPFDRRIREGHLTASALIVSADAARIVLLHHRKLGRWLQPGGHAERGEDDGPGVAQREAGEETGIEKLELHPSAPRPLDVDVHEIPARIDEPAHLHLDLRYLFVAPASAALRLAPEEARRVEWFTWDQLTALDLDAGLTRALGKVRSWTHRLTGPAGSLDPAR